MALIKGKYAAEEVANHQASGAPVKLSTYGATVAAGIIGVLTLLDPTFNAVFGANTDPWLKVVVFGVVLVVWGAIMVADTLARKAPSHTIEVPREHGAVRHEYVAAVGQQLDALGRKVDELDTRVGEHVGVGIGVDADDS